jgi:hypothetical protein
MYIGISDEFGKLDISSSESVEPSLLDTIIVESLIVHEPLFVNDQVLIETFEQNSFWMEERLY